jgi:hypothetical protein
VGLWEVIQPGEYGFWANVNPKVPHPRWSQAMEWVLHTGELVPTQIYNGYGAQVAALYAGMELATLFMWIRGMSVQSKKRRPEKPGAVSCGPRSREAARQVRRINMRTPWLDAAAAEPDQSSDAPISRRSTPRPALAITDQARLRQVTAGYMSPLRASEMCAGPNGSQQQRSKDTKKAGSRDPAEFDWKCLLGLNLQRGTLKDANGRRNASRR